MSTDKENRLIVITGASQGLGAAIARRFAMEGPCRLALLARSEDRLKEVAAECARHRGVEAEAIPADVRDEKSVNDAAKRVISSFGAPDVLINNAGIFRGGSFLEFPLADFDELYAVNLRGPFLVSRAFIDGMIRKGAGDIVNIGSVAALGPHPGGTGYCAAKAGLAGLTNVMRKELRPHGIHVTLVHPGAIATPSWDGSGVPAEVMMPPEDVAEAVVALTGLSRRTVVEEIILRPARGEQGA